MTKKKTSAPAQVAPKKKRVWHEGGPQDAAKEQERRLRGLPGYKKMTGLERFRAGLSVSDEMKQEDLKRRIPDEAERAAYNKKENERKENIKKRCEELSREFRVACYDTGLGDALEREGEIKAVMLAAHKLEIPEGGSNLTGGQLFDTLQNIRKKKESLPSPLPPAAGSAQEEIGKKTLALVEKLVKPTKTGPPKKPLTRFENAVLTELKNIAKTPKIKRLPTNWADGVARVVCNNYDKKSAVEKAKDRKEIEDTKENLRKKGDWKGIKRGKV